MTRNIIKTHQVAATVIVVLLIASALAWIVYSLISSRQFNTTGPDARAYFTVDDGKAYFADDAGKVPPFDHEGAQAVRAFVFTNGKGERWVQHLQKFSDDDKRRMETAGKSPVFSAGLVKRPADKEWASGTSAAGLKAMTPSFPKGFGSGDIKPVIP